MAYMDAVSRLRYWCQTVLPAVYDDSLSYYELLCRISSKLNELITKDNEVGEVLGVTVEQVEQMQKLLEEIRNGKYADLYIDQLASYIDKNLAQIVARIVYYVFPCFYWDGDSWRFSMVIPSGWDWLRFSFPAVETENEFTYHISLTY